MKISESKAPDIFTDIKPFEYCLLWPLAARQLYKNEQKKNAFHHPEYKDRSWLDWFFKFDIKKCKKPQGKDMLLGRFLSMFGCWRLADKGLADYIRERF